MEFQKSEFEKILSEIEKYRKKDEALTLKFDKMITNVFFSRVTPPAEKAEKKLEATKIK